MNKIKLLIKQILNKAPMLKNDIANANVEFHGSNYGGWSIFSGSINENSVVYSVGLGTDVSFDQSIIGKYNCKVFGIDPTPGVEDFIMKSNLKGFSYIKAGLAETTGQAKFFLPDNPEFISHSFKSENTSEYILVDVYNLADLMKLNGHDKIDLLKCDIEGFEYGVINFLIEKNLKIKQLLIEFHHGMYGFTNEDTINSIKNLKDYGFKLFNISNTGREYSFIYES
jgi:FkbM family methyltransferase